MLRVISENKYNKAKKILEINKDILSKTSCNIKGKTGIKLRQKTNLSDFRIMNRLDIDSRL